MNLALFVLVLALLWAAITGQFSLPNLIVGALIGLAALFLLRDRFSMPVFVRRLARLARLGVFLLKEIMLSALGVGRAVLSPRIGARIAPAIVAVPLRVSRDGEIALLANLVTLTPGTLSVDVSEDKRFLYVHALRAASAEAVAADIAQGFEARIIKAFE